MVGLLGTVFGMIEAFIEISTGDVHGVRQMGLAEGVSKALIATAGGLAISIPALAFYSIFRGRVHKYVSQLEAAATHLLILLHAQLECRTSGRHAWGSPKIPHCPVYQRLHPAAGVCICVCVLLMSLQARHEGPGGRVCFALHRAGRDLQE